MTHTTTRRGVLALGAGLAAGALPTARAQGKTAPLVVYAVRHTEKASGGRDPELSEAGQARAAELARVLADVPLDAIHSTPFKRTRDTAAPLAKAKGLQVQDYHPAKIVDQITAGSARTVLVVGHSNTTPAVVRGLGAKFSTEILDGYDDLFLTIRTSGRALLQHLHYGAPSEGGGHGHGGPSSRPAKGR